MRAFVLCAWFCAGALVLAQQIDIGPPPGRLIDIGARQLHFNCTGSGSPVVILEAGASSFALDWSLVQPEIARTNRVCSYDRAGFGWSSARGEVDTPARVVLDLHAALAAAGEKPPYVLVGASFGAMYVRLYQLDYPDEVAGLVPFAANRGTVRSPRSGRVPAPRPARSASDRIGRLLELGGRRSRIGGRRPRRLCAIA